MDVATSCLFSGLCGKPLLQRFANMSTWKSRLALNLIAPSHSDNLLPTMCVPLMFTSCIWCVLLSPTRWFYSTPFFSLFLFLFFYHSVFISESCSPLVSCHNTIGLTSYLCCTIPLNAVRRLCPNTNLSKTSSPFTLHSKSNTKSNLSLRYLPFFSLQYLHNFSLFLNIMHHYTPPLLIWYLEIHAQIFSVYLFTVFVLPTKMPGSAFSYGPIACQQCMQHLLWQA